MSHQGIKCSDKAGNLMWANIYILENVTLHTINIYLIYNDYGQ